MSSEVIKGLRFGDSQESYFEAWKRSHMDCSALLCGRFADSQESRFQVSERSNMGCAVLEGDRSADNQEFCFGAAKRSDMVCVELQGCFLMIFTNGIFRSRNVLIIAVSCCKRIIC